MDDERVERLILMPRRRLRARAARLSAGATRLFDHLDSLAGVRDAVELLLGVKIRVLDSIRGDGPKLIEVRRGDIPAIRAAHPEFDLVPVVHYSPAIAPQPTALAAPAAAAAGGSPTPFVRLQIVDALTGKPVHGARIRAFTDFDALAGRNAVSDEDGLAALDFQTTPVALDRLYVYPPLAGYWGHFRASVSLADKDVVALQPIDVGHADGLRHFYPPAHLDAGAGVTVGIIDCGVGPHPDLECEGDSDNGSGHGTHVAGIIAARGTASTGMRGLAPGVRLRSYRVISQPGGLARNFSVAKAIDTAVLEHKCDIINLSFVLEDANEDAAVRLALEDAREAGVLPIAATGNRYRQSVGFPASDSLCIAVSALGRKGTFPGESTEAADVVPPFGTDPDDYVAAFSNIGLAVDVAAPGSGIISTVPGGYGVMSGTSMACPVVTGMAARLLARNQALFAMERSPERSVRLAQLVLGAASTLGFAADLQGAGLLQESGEV